jgi:hypothetical protein
MSSMLSAPAGGWCGEPPFGGLIGEYSQAALTIWHPQAPEARWIGARPG